MSRVAVVTDSAADLPPAIAASAGILVVPLSVRFGDRAFLDGIDLSPAGFWDRASRGEVPTTASPSPGELIERYGAAADGGAAAVVSVHVSQGLSRTAETARLAARDAPLPVEVVDSRSVSLGQGLVALAAAGAARSDADPDAVAAAARAAAERLRVCAFVDTVEFLQRGGRIGRGKAALSDLLRIRPVLALEDGEPALIARPRTRARAVDAVLERCAVPASACAIFHAGAPEAAAVARELAARCGAEPLIGEVGAVTGTHLGPRSLGVAVLPR